MVKPGPPVLLSEAKIDKDGIRVSWMVGGNVQADTHTVSWKAESWWQASSCTLPAQENEYLIDNIPPNEKIKVYMYTTNKEGSSGYSNEVSFVSSRDCCVKGEAEPDFVSEELPYSADELIKIIYTEDFQEFATKNPKVGTFEVLSHDDKHMITRITPPVPAKLRSTIEAITGPFELSYEEHAVKDVGEKTVTFEVKNFSCFQEYIDTCGGTTTVIPTGDGTCQTQHNFDFRLKGMPMMGYYISQLIKAQMIGGSSEFGNNVKAYRDRETK